MKKLCLFIAVSGLLVTGCASNSTFSPVANCKPLAAYNSVAITPFSTDRVIVTEVRLQTIASTGTLNGISDSVSATLKSRLDKTRKFDKVVTNGSCTDRAVKIAGKLTAFTHRKGRYYLHATGELSDCKTGESLYKFELTESDSDLLMIPKQIADEVFYGIQGRMSC